MRQHQACRLPRTATRVLRTFLRTPAWGRGAGAFGSWSGRPSNAASLSRCFATGAVLARAVLALAVLAQAVSALAVWPLAVEQQVFWLSCFAGCLALAVFLFWLRLFRL